MQDGTTNGNGSGTSEDQAAAIAVILATIEYPASRDELVGAAEDADATDEIVVIFQDLPDRLYESQTDVNRAISERQDTTAA